MVLCLLGQKKVLVYFRQKLHPLNHVATEYLRFAMWFAVYVNNTIFLAKIRLQMNHKWLCVKMIPSRTFQNLVGHRTKLF